MTNTVFGKIIAGEISAEKIYEDEHCIAINDINPQAPVHVLVIPKKSIQQLSHAKSEDESLLGHLLLVVNKLAAELGVDDGYRVLINNGENSGQTVFHLHVHLIAGYKMSEKMI